MSTSIEHAHGCTCDDCAAKHLANTSELQRRHGGGVWCNFCGGEHAPSVCPTRGLVAGGGAGARSERDEIHPGGDEGHNFELPREMRIMTDYRLAHELGDTLMFLVGLHPVEKIHQDRIARAIRFLRGERERSGLEDAELHQLLHHDPAVNAIFRAASALAHRQIEGRAHLERTQAEMAALGAIPTSIPEGGTLPEGVVGVPELCDRCMSHVIHKSLQAKESDSWRAWIVIVQLLLLQVVEEDEEAKTLGGAQDLQGRLLAIGCLGCRYPRALHQAGLLIRIRGAEFAGEVVKGSAKAINWDPRSLARRRQ